MRHVHRWSSPSIALHWLGALIIVGLAVVGSLMTDLAPESETRRLMSRLHGIGGFALMVLTLLRLLMRKRGVPEEPLALPPIHRRGVGLVHVLLYGVVFSLGLSGAATGVMSGWPEYLQGTLAAVPSFENVPTREVHGVLVFALFGLVGLHVAGVIVQQIRRGGAIERMLPRGR